MRGSTRQWEVQVILFLSTESGTPTIPRTAPVAVAGTLASEMLERGGEQLAAPAGSLHHLATPIRRHKHLSGKIACRKLDDHPSHPGRPCPTHKALSHPL